MATENGVNEGSAEQETKNLCQSCSHKEAIYKCPGCGTRTCSLPCTKSHRESFGCPGKRNRTGPVKVSEFTDKQLMADIRLMEEIGREFDSARRREPQRLPAKLPPMLQELRREAGKRSVDLQFLGPGMQKRLQNSTYHDRRAKKLLWHIEWHFVAANLHVHDRRIPEDAIMDGLLDKHVRPQKRGFKDDEKMLPYTKAGTAGLAVLMRQARAPVTDVRHFRIDLRGNLANQLEKKVIVEFPVFLVLLPEEVKKYAMVSDADSSGLEDSSSGSESATGGEEGSTE